MDPPVEQRNQYLTGEPVRARAASLRLPAYFDRSALVLTLLLGVTGLAYLWTPTDPDLWWHLRNGKLVLDQGVPLYDVFSFTVAGQRWIVHEWLTEVAMYLIYTAAGYGLLLLTFALCSVATYALLYRILRGAGAGPPLAVALLIMCLLMDAPGWGVRPQILINLCFLLTLALLLGYRRRAAAAPPAGGLAAWIGADPRLWLVPPLFLLWVNLHSGFIVGPMLLGVWIVGEATNAVLGWRAGAPLRPLLAVAIVSALLTLLNPNGLDQWLYPLSYLGGSDIGNPLLFVQEWQPPDARKLQHAPFVLSLLTVLAVAMLRPRQEPPATPPGEQAVPAERTGLRIPAQWVPVVSDATLLLGMSLFLLMALRAMRLQPQWGAFWALGMVMALPRLWPALGRDRNQPTPPVRVALNLGLAAGTLALLAAVLLASPRAQAGAQPRLDAYPVEAVAYLAAHPEIAADPLYNAWNWGGYLIYTRWPTARVFIDGRADIYRGAVVNDYVATLPGGPDWPVDFARYGIRGALVARDTPLARALAADPAWQQHCCATGPALLFTQRVNSEQ